MPGGRFVGLSTAPVAPWPHQEVVARRLISSFPYHYLLCDEVGLGKTVEAGLSLRSLILSGFIQRMVIAAPKSLTGQWQRELADKLLLSFDLAETDRYARIFPEEETRPTDNLFRADRVIISTGLLVRKERLREFRAVPAFDAVLVDEAHYARRKNLSKAYRGWPSWNQLYEALEDTVRRRTTCLWLATATPMQIHPVEIGDLLRLTDRAGAFQFDPSLTQAYYDALGKLVRSERPTGPDWDFLRQALSRIKVEDPLYWDYLSRSVFQGPVGVQVQSEHHHR